ncbi:MBOAT family O-acyltransferase [Ferruginibacter paludis]|uniref:MBOAT family O-acyltransferase n=1 Tax=Ferruginibacter paludis TaxID=1310417 RepID=UPI0025B60BA1|nr:MBOAT family O-acyltransferase [Ferruginibacter paludis]MDN3657623.1 MBOAT family O-acyltransferase [Ferruginibacter paludis]
MIFTSIPFFLFFISFAFLYYIFPLRFRWVWILASSLFFYMYGNPYSIIIIASIIFVTWFCALRMEKGPSEKVTPYFLFAIIINIALLVFFKYANFFTSTVFDLTNIVNTQVFHAGAPYSNPFILNVIAPLGLSYVTFQAIGYLIEIKRGNHKAEGNIGYLSTFLLFFPKIIAGPVERAHHILPQLKQYKPFNYDNISKGLKLIIWGLFKKLVIADRLSIYVDAVLDNAGHHSGTSISIAVIFYVFQMYADFSGYTDMALGISKVLGFDLLQNFNRPLLAKSITEFWRKWHISLSTWFADYFYTPIAISKRDWGIWSVVYAFFITFITLGFWHGANWTFVVFGALQGFILTIEFFTRKARKNMRKKIPPLLNNIIGTIFTVGYFALSLIFFRASSVKDSLIIIRRIFTIKGPVYIENPTIILFSLLGIFFLALIELKREYFDTLFNISTNRHWFIRNCYYCFLLLAILIAGVFDGGEFIYFQF